MTVPLGELPWSLHLRHDSKVVPSFDVMEDVLIRGTVIYNTND